MDIKRFVTSFFNFSTSSPTVKCKQISHFSFPLEDRYTEEISQLGRQKDEARKTITLPHMLKSSLTIGTHGFYRKSVFLNKKKIV